MNRPLKVLVDGHVLDAGNQGSGTYIAGLYSALSRRTDFVIYVATNKSSSLSSFGEDAERIRWAPLSTNSRIRRLASEFDRICEEVQPDFCHFQYITPLRKRTRWVTTIHDVLFLDFPEYFPKWYRFNREILYRRSALRSDCLLTVSEYSRRQISHHMGLPLDAITVTPNGVGELMHVENTPVKGLENEDFYLCVGRLEPRKNQHVLIDAYNRSGLRESTKLVLVGTPTIPYPELEQQLRSPLNEGKVVHLQDVPPENLAWLYRSALAAFYPSQCEGFGLPPLEAVALGTPSYCGRNSALAELANYVSGIIDPNAVDSIVSAMRKHTLRTGVPLELQASVRDTFSWDRSAAVLADTLTRLSTQTGILPASATSR